MVKVALAETGENGSAWRLMRQPLGGFDRPGRPGFSNARDA
jgi:hypothetical protein